MIACGTHVCSYISVGRLSLFYVFLTEYDPFLEIDIRS